MQELTVNLLVPQESQKKLNIQTVDVEDRQKICQKKSLNNNRRPDIRSVKSPSFALTDSTTSNTQTEPPQITLSPPPGWPRMCAT